MQDKLAPFIGHGDRDKSGVHFSVDAFKKRISEALLERDATGSVSTEGLGNPKPVDLSDLLLIQSDDEFLRQAYRRIFLRECDISGFLHYREMLQKNTPRRAILDILTSSEEARRTGLHFVGMGGSKGAKRGFLSRLRIKLTVGIQMILGRAHWLYRMPLLRPFELLDHKLDYLAHEVQQRSEQLSIKLDEYSAYIRRSQDEAMGRLATLESQLTAALANTDKFQSTLKQALASDLERQAELLSARLASQTAGLQEGLKQLQTRLAAIEGKQTELGSYVTALQLHMDEALVREHQQRSEQLSVKLDNYVAHLLAVQQQVLTAITGLEAFQSKVKQDLVELQRLMEARLRAPLVSAGDDILVTSVEGFILALPAREWRLAAYLAFHGPLEPGVTKFFRSLIKPGMVVVDVGAHFGWYTLQAARQLAGRGKIHSFEPTPHTFALLRQNIQVNGFLETGVVELHEAAIAERSGMASFAMYAEDSTHNTLFPGGDCVQMIEVRALSLDEALENEPQVDVVKIDAEGAEPLILRGLRKILERNSHVRILMEFAPGNLRRAGFSAEAFADEIGALGLVAARIDDLTGDVHPVGRQDLTAAYSLMLLLTRADLTPERR
jgi:FkbM family methyltransferase